MLSVNLLKVKLIDKHVGHNRTLIWPVLKALDHIGETAAVHFAQMLPLPEIASCGHGAKIKLCNSGQKEISMPVRRHELFVRA
jgi:hypothetical protein